jgi:hypothetical protein
MRRSASARAASLMAGVMSVAIWIAFSPAVPSPYRSASRSDRSGSASFAASRRVARSGIGISTTAIFGFESSFGDRSVRFSATRSTTLSPFSIAGRNDQR